MGQPAGTDESAGSTPSTDFGPGLEHVTVREWGSEKEEGVNADEDGEHRFSSAARLCVPALGVLM